MKTNSFLPLVASSSQPPPPPRSAWRRGVLGASRSTPLAPEGRPARPAGCAGIPCPPLHNPPYPNPVLRGPASSPPSYKVGLCKRAGSTYAALGGACTAFPRPHPPGGGKRMPAAKGIRLLSFSRHPWSDPRQRKRPGPGQAIPPERERGRHGRARAGGGAGHTRRNGCSRPPILRPRVALRSAKSDRKGWASLFHFKKA